MMENTQWVPQETVKPTQNPPLPIVNQGQTPPSVPNANKGNSLPWFLWVLAGCGCIGFVVIPIIIIIAIVAINPLSKINDTQNGFHTKEIENIGKAVTDCVGVEKTKATPDSKIYSVETCANKDYLYDNRYVSVQPWSDLRLSTNPSKTKICAYITYYDYKTKEDLVTSWNSDAGISESGKGTKICDSSKEPKSNVATGSATSSAQ